MIPTASDEEIKERLAVLVPTYRRLDIPNKPKANVEEDLTFFKENKRFIDAQVLKESQLAKENAQLTKLRFVSTDISMNRN